MSSSKKKTCEICKIKTCRINNQKRIFMARFPLDEDRCKQWVAATGNKNLIHVPIEKLNLLKYICGKHFREKDFNKKKTQLRKNAVPVIDIFKNPLPDDMFHSFPLHIQPKAKCDPRKDVLQDHNYCKHTDQEPTTSGSDIFIECDSKRKRSYSPKPSTSGSVILIESDFKRQKSSSPKPSTSDSNFFIKSDSKRNRSQSPKPSTSGSKILIECDSIRQKSNSPKPSTSDYNFLIEIDSKRNGSQSPKPSTSGSEILIDCDSIRQKSNIPKPSTSGTEIKIEIDSQQHRSHSPKPSTSTLAVLKKSDSKVKKSCCQKTPVLLSPRKQKLMKKIKKSRILIKNLQKRVNKIDNISSPVLKSFIESSLANQKRKPKGKRYTKFSKSVALAIYKKSPKAFKYLSTFLSMPSIRTLQTILQNMKMEPGIDPTTLDHLKKKVDRLSDADKLCMMLFDEISLKRRLIYNPATDKIDGYEDLGDEGGRTEKIADHALVLMLQGIHKKIKQPIAYYFVKGTIAAEKLTVIIKTVIREVTKAGFTVLGTVCDQGPTNVGALNLLKSFSGLPADCNYFLLDNEKVFIIFDVPHLFKSIRNNFYQSGEIVMNDKRGKWEHLVKLEEKNRTTLHFNKISKLHVEPKFRSKMRVKLATQILSNTVAAILKLLAESLENKEEATAILQTAYIVEELDKLFDCTNGPASSKDIKKGIRQNVSNKSFHHERWPEYKNKLKTLAFLKSDSQIRLRNVRCVNGYIITITSLQDIWKVVHSRNFKYLNLRQCNQDALENLFGLIRQHCPTNKNPTCHHFTSALKSAVLARLSAPISRGANCQQDENEILFDFQNIVFHKQSTEKENDPNCGNCHGNIQIQVLDNDYIPTLHIPDELIENDLGEMEKNFKKFEKQPTVYVAGYLAKLLLKDVNCQRCINAVKVKEPISNSIYNYIALREWWHDKISLTYPTLHLCSTVDTATNIFDQKIIPNIFLKHINTFSKTQMLASLDFSWMCEDHKSIMVNRLLQRLSLLLIRNYCRISNRSFALKEESSADSLKKAQLQGVAK